MSSVLSGNQELAAATGLIVSKLLPRLNAAMDRASDLYPGDADDEALTHWMNGAIYGCVLSFMTDNQTVAPSKDDVCTLNGAVCAMLDEIWSEEDNGDADKTMMRLIPDAFV